MHSVVTKQRTSWLTVAYFTSSFCTLLLPSSYSTDATSTSTSFSSLPPPPPPPLDPSPFSALFTFTLSPSSLMPPTVSTRYTLAAVLTAAVAPCLSNTRQRSRVEVNRYDFGGARPCTGREVGRKGSGQLGRGRLGGPFLPALALLSSDALAPFFAASSPFSKKAMRSAMPGMVFACFSIPCPRTCSHPNERWGEGREKGSGEQAKPN
mmetsp:Transcript_48423/g.125619  ORF Transcript_48423/g.125619 Transcript_48423/m.125619 type:complete len:208 (+) Transcript_48423:1441-2064(+)